MRLSSTASRALGTKAQCCQTKGADCEHAGELVEPAGGAAYPLYFPRKEQGFPDIFVRPDRGTARRLPWHPGTDRARTTRPGCWHHARVHRAVRADPELLQAVRPYSWAGTSVSWSYDNRSTGIRAITGHPGEARLEHRLPGADTNPYIVMAACLAGGLHGIEQKMLGEDFVRHYAAMKRFEAEKYRQQVSEWEVRRYVEMA
jgi:hypothetical protein